MALDQAMMTALLQGNEDFVSLFVDNGVHLGKFLTIRTLIDVYKRSLDETNTMAAIVNNLMSKIKVDYNLKLNYIKISYVWQI